MTLDGRTGIEWIWRLAGDETQTISPGKYSIKVVLDTSAATTAEAWKGAVSSRPATLVFESPRQYSSEEETRRGIQNARVDAIGGNSDAAIARLLTLTESQPKNVEALALAASLLADDNRLEEAQRLYNRAIEAWYESSANLDAVPVRLLRARREIQKRLLAQEH